jgi:zinc-binding in reverse transcriptase
MWLVLHGKILTRSNILQRGWRGGGAVSCPCCAYHLETIDHLFVSCPLMHDFWHSFNPHNTLLLRLPLISIGDIWEYGCSLPKSQRLLFLSLFSVILWVQWNERNKLIFQQQSLMLFNDFVYKVSHLFSMWTGI